ncbi:MAG TPA: metalloregulator ArsR/SmtB family transcription factor [Candidatus Limnocylindria bacterium]
MAEDRLSVTFGALADPTRRAILARLAKGGASVSELAEPFDMSLAAVSKHLKVLERAGLVSRGREAQWRPVALEAAPLKEIDAWVERYRAIWEQRLDRLDVYLSELREKEKRHGRTR